MFEEKSSGAGSRRLLAGVAVVVVLVTGGWLYAKYVPAEMAYRGLRDASFYAYNFESFVDDYSKSHRLSDVDDLLYRQVTQQFEDTYRWRLYKNLFPSGRHAAELDKRLSDRKVSELAALKERMEPERASLFLQWFYDTPEGVECRELLLDHLERTGAGNRCSPPVAVFRRLLQAHHSGKITYSRTGYTYQGSLHNRLWKVFNEVGLRLEESTPGLIRVDTERIEEKDIPLVAGNDLEVPSLTVRSAVSIHLPGEPKPAWTYTFEAKTPDTVRFEQASNSKDTGSFTVAVADATAKEMDAAVEGLFHYWWPEADSRYWRRFQEFRSWYGQAPFPGGRICQTEGVAHRWRSRPDAARASSPDGRNVRAADGASLRSAQGRRLRCARCRSVGGISLEPLRKTIQLRSRLERTLEVARMKFEK